MRSITTNSAAAEVSASPAFYPGSWLDQSGCVLKHHDDEWVYRALRPEGEAVLKFIEQGIGLERLIAAGLVRTRVAERNFSALPGFTCLLAHRRIRRLIYPAEWTSAMWKSALETFCNFNVTIRAAGMYLQDAHALNLLFDSDGKPVFIDFGSLKIRRKKFEISRAWHLEFRRRFLFPIVLHNLGFRSLAAEAMREPSKGPLKMNHQFTIFFGVMFWFNCLYWFCKAFGSESLYFSSIKKIVCRKYDRAAETRWSVYKSAEAGWKADAVNEAFQIANDASDVLDLAGNKGTHAFKAVSLGKSAILADVDEVSLEVARRHAREQSIPVFIAKMDLCHPAPESGIGLFYPNAYERLQSDLVLALAVSHHLAFRNKVPFHTLAAILDRYSRRYILTEYIDVTDVHVAKWISNKKWRPLPDYNEGKFLEAFQQLGYTKLREWRDPAAGRVIVLLRKGDDYWA